MEHGARSAHEQFVRRVRRLGAHPPNRQAGEIYQLSKEIDGRREGTGTFPLFGVRVTKLSLLSNGHRAFYEPLGTYDDLLGLSRVNARLVDGGAPPGALNHLSVSIRVFESAYDAPLGELPLPAPGEREQGVHQVSLNGTLARGGDMLLLFRNSWGRWGYEGSGVFPREYLERYMVEAWLSRRDAIGPSRFTRPLLDVNAAEPKAYVRVWMLRFPLLAALNSWAITSTVRHRAEEHTIQVYESVSASEDPVEIIEVRGPSGVPLGWAHLHHLVDAQQRVSVGKEFFVWPLVRGLGYGRLLEEFVAARAKAWGSKQLRILFHEADDYPGNVTEAKAFATGADYEWKWSIAQRPRISAVADKSL
jgi:GNAT superfamily N-acetyltransferase